MLTAVALVASFLSKQTESWSLKSMESALRHGLSVEQESSLRRWFGSPERLKQGADPKIEDLAVAWAIEAPAGTKTASVVSDDATPWSLNLKRVGKQNLFVAMTRLAEGAGFRWRYVLDGKPVGDDRQIEVYTTPPESKPDPSVPRGRLESQARLVSQVFGGTAHDWWLYTPANFDPAVESNLVVFQDGQWARSYAPVYFDHLIAKHEIAQTVVVFVSPGTFPDGRSDRSREYNTLSDRYVRFLLDELLPQVETKYRISQDPMRRCVAGLSSGGICSFTCAWQRPDKFGLVMTWIGSFTNIASGENLQSGGHNYPALIRKTSPKPIRIFLQDGDNDLDNVHGNWPLANREMIAALQFAKYDLKWVWGKGFHSDRHGRATLADALRWLFRPGP